MKQLAAGVYKTGWYGYVQAGLLADRREDEDARLALADVSSCGVCAKGAAMLSYVRLYDNLRVGRLGADTRSADLAGIFTQRQLDLIEAAYEGYGPDAGNGFGNDRTAAYYDYYYDDPSKPPGECRNGLLRRNGLLLAILLNIIRNKGTFKPEPLAKLRPVKFPKWALLARVEETDISPAPAAATTGC